MSDCVEYELVCLHAEQETPEDQELFPLSGVDTEQLIWAHRVAATMLTFQPTCLAQKPYTNRSGNMIRLPESTADHAYATVKLKRIDPKSVTAIAEVAAALNCKLVPADGGPEVAANAEALMQDVMRRALEGVRPGGQSLFELSGGARRAARVRADPDEW